MGQGAVRCAREANARAFVSERASARRRWKRPHSHARTSALPSRSGKRGKPLPYGRFARLMLLWLTCGASFMVHRVGVGARSSSRCMNTFEPP